MWVTDYVFLTNILFSAERDNGLIFALFSDPSYIVWKVSWVIEMRVCRLA